MGAKEKYKHLSLTSVTKTGGDRVICVIKADEEQQLKMAWLKDQAELTDLDEAFGFSRVIQKITESGKLVVGHNMILDIAHTLNQFCGPLPETYQDFKAMTTAVFPKLLDTKLMANTIPFKQEIFNSSLEELHKAVTLPPYNLPPVPPKFSGSGYKPDSANFHEAGFDAYITGLCFIAMSNRLGLLVGTGDKTKAGRVLPDSFSNQAFNIYVWPRPCSRNAPDPRFLCQTSSIDFLTNQNFDFNKLFKHGVSYLRPAELEKLKSAMKGRQENRRLSQTPGTEQNQAISIPT